MPFQKKMFKLTKIIALFALILYSIMLFVVNIYYYTSSSTTDNINRNNNVNANTNNITNDKKDAINYNSNTNNVVKKEIKLLPKVNFGVDIVGGHQLTVAINSSEAIKEFIDSSNEFILNFCKEKNVKCNIENDTKNDVKEDKKITVKMYLNDDFLHQIDERKDNNNNNINDQKKKLSDKKLQLDGENEKTSLLDDRKNDHRQNDKYNKKKYKTHIKQLIRGVKNAMYQWDIDVATMQNDKKHGNEKENNKQGIVFSMTLTDKMIKKIIADTTDKAISVLKNRIDNVGVKEISVQRYGMNKIVILIPRDVNVEHIKKIINTTAKLNFHLMDAHHIFYEKPKHIAKNHVLLPSYNSNKNDNLLYYLVEEQVALKGDCIADVQPNIDGISNSINFRMNSNGTKKFSDVTSKNIGRLLAIVLDDKVLMAPMINVAIVNGAGSITGRFTAEETRDLSILLRSGSLPTKISIINEKQLSSVFDKNLLSNAFVSFLCSLGIVTLLMFARYRIYGCIAIVALILNFLFTFSIISIFGLTLTLPGIAGFILMLGMATDANILIYEKMKDLRKQGIDDDEIIVKSGFSRAIGTIFDANITTIIAGIALFGFGGSFIKSFSITLIFGILCSIFTAVNITKMMINTFLRLKNRINYC